MYNNIIYFAFQSIFIVFSILTSAAFIISYFIGSDDSIIFLVNFLFILLITYFINVFKKNIFINRLSFIYFTIVGWLLIILVSAIPLYELLSLNNFTEIFFFTTSQVTTSGFDIGLKNYHSKLILSLWVSIIQNMGAIYALLIFLIYSNLYFNNSLLMISKKNIIKLYLIYFLFLISFFLFFFIDNYDFFLSLSYSSSILSSTGYNVFSSVYLNYDANYLIISFMMLSALFILPALLISNSKNPYKIISKLLVKNKSNAYLFFFIVVSLLIIFSEINLDFSKKLLFVITLITTTGSLPQELEEYTIQLTLSNYLLIILFTTIIGSFSGTTNGGLKINKLSIFFINFKEELNKFLFQHNIKGVNIVKKGFSQNELNTFYALLVFTSIIVLLCIIILNISGISLKMSFIYIIASLSNTGESLLIINNISDKIKSEYYFLLNLLMICGRYEFIGYFLIFNKVFKVRKLI